MNKILSLIILFLPLQTFAQSLSDIDKTPAEIKVLNSESGEFLSGPKTVRFAVSDFNGVQEFSVKDGSRTLLSARNIPVITTEWSVVYQPTNPRGVKRLKFEITDMAGNKTEHYHLFHFWPNKIPSALDVKFLAPLNSQTLSNTTPVTLEITDREPIEVTHVDVYVNGTLIGRILRESGENTWIYNLDTNRFPNGESTIDIIAYNTAGVTQSDLKQVTFDNGSSAPRQPLPPIVAPLPPENGQPPVVPTPTPQPVAPAPAPQPPVGPPPPVTPTPENPAPTDPSPTPVRPDPIPEQPAPPSDEDATAIMLQQMIATVTQLLQLLDQATKNGEEVSPELEQQVLAAIAEITAFLNTLTRDNARTLRSNRATRRIPKLVKRTNRNVKKALRAKKKRRRNRQLRSGKRKLNKVRRAL